MKFTKPIEATVYPAREIMSEFDSETKVVLAKAHEAIVKDLMMRNIRLVSGLLLIRDPFTAPKQFQELYVGARLIDVIDDFLGDREPVMRAFESWYKDGNV